MKCPHCGEEVKPKYHNGNNWRCVYCWGVLPEPKPEQPKHDIEIEEKAPPKLKPRPAPRVPRRVRKNLTGDK